MNIIVNGGTHGIGKEVVLRLAQDGVNHILVTGRDEKALIDHSTLNNNVYSLSIDLSKIDTQIDKFREGITTHFKNVDILINMAGYLISRNFSETSANDARLMMETNFFGPATCIRIVRPYMQEGSHIVNISSMGGFQGSSKYNGLSYYSASKAALACLSECLSTEFYGSGISVNCLALGAVQTQMLEEAFPGYIAPIDSKKMAEFICNFALNGHKFINGKIIPVALTNP